MRGVVEGVVLKNLTAAFVPFVHDALFSVKQEVVDVRMVDPANVCLIMATIPKEAFETFDYDKDEVFGLDIERVHEILKLAKKKDLVSIKTEDSLIKFKLSNLEYSLTKIDPSAVRKIPKVPELKLNAKVVLNAMLLKTALKSAGKIAESVEFLTDESGFYVRAEGETDSITMHLGELDPIDFNREAATSRYSLEYLTSALKCVSPGDIATVRFGTNMPVDLTLDVAEGKLRVKYIIAPRIEAF